MAFDLGKKMPGRDGEIRPGVTKMLQSAQVSFGLPSPGTLIAL